MGELLILIFVITILYKTGIRIWNRRLTSPNCVQHLSVLQCLISVIIKLNRTIVDIKIHSKFAVLFKIERRWKVDGSTRCSPGRKAFSASSDPSDRTFLFVIVDARGKKERKDVARDVKTRVKILRKMGALVSSYEHLLTKDYFQPVLGYVYFLSDRSVITSSGVQIVNTTDYKIFIGMTCYYYDTC